MTPAHTVPVIGLAGGIGAGKSAAARAFAELGCVISDSDAQARDALEREDVRRTLVEWWGQRVLDRDGRVDRRAVAAIVFDSDDERSRLEGLIHPLVRRSRESLIGQAIDSGAPAVIVDAPLLFEAGLDAECDAVVFIDAPRELRLARVAARGWDDAELRRREKAQLPIEEKRRRSSYHLQNTGDLASLHHAARRVLTDVLAKHHQQNGPPSGR